jgi:hypothetical protein
VFEVTVAAPRREEKIIASGTVAQDLGLGRENRGAYKVSVRKSQGKNH